MKLVLLGLIVNCNDYSYEKVDALREKVADIRRSSSIFSKYPMEESESREKWKTRVEPQMESDMTRKDGESVADHMKRMFELKSETQEIAPQILSAVCETFNLRTPADEDFKKSNWLDVKQFIYNVLSLGDIPCDDFLPKKPLE